MEVISKNLDTLFFAIEYYGSQWMRYCCCYHSPLCPLSAAPQIVGYRSPRTACEGFPVTLASAALLVLWSLLD